MNLGVERRTPGKNEDVQRGELRARERQIEQLNPKGRESGEADRDGGRKSRNLRKNQRSS